MTFPDPPDLPRKPDVVPSNDVYVTSTAHPRGRRTAAMPDFWSYEGARVREVLSELHDLPESRVELHVHVDDDARYDFVLVPPHVEAPAKMRALMLEGIVKYFGLRIDREARTADVFVMTAPGGITGLHAQSGGLGAMTMDMTVPEGFEDLSDDEQRAFFEQHLRGRISGLRGGASGNARPTGHVGASGDCTTGHLCRMLEGMLGRLVVDETGTDGGFEFDISTERGVDGFLEALRERFGILVTPDRRDVEMLVVRAR